MILAVMLAGAGLAGLTASLLAYFNLPWFHKSVSNPNNFPHYLTALFTFILAVFACYAWLATREGTAALQGQLNAMQTDQRPFIWVVEIRPPTYDNTGDQIRWEIGFADVGKGIAYQVVVRAYIKVGDERYERTRSVGDHPVELVSSDAKMIPPNLPFNLIYDDCLATRNK
jgi:hypothetical protein